MVKLAVAALLLGACVADDATLPPETERDEAVIDDVELVDHHHDAADLCAMASELPTSDVCSLICDPEAFKARLVDGGMEGGNCYQLRCSLSAEMTVTVGVCIP